MDWLEVSVQADREAVESVSEVLTRFGYGGVVIEEPGTPGPDGDYQVDLAAPITVRAYLAMDDAAARRQRDLEQALWHLSRLRPIGPLQTRPVREQDWATAWKSHYRPQRVSERIVVIPAWEAYTPEPGLVTVILDPGMAFGTGTHPTTRLCLAEMERCLRPGMRVLDVGTGSGILAIAAGRLGAATVLALDTDPVAVNAATENVALNGLADVVHVAPGTIGARGELILLGSSSPPWQRDLYRTEFDLVVANLTSAIIAQLATGLLGALGPAGVLIVSGVIDELEDKARAALDAAGFALLRRAETHNWVAFVGGRAPHV